MSLRVPISGVTDLPARRGGELIIVGPGRSSGVDLSGLRFTRIVVETDRSLTQTVFEQCDLSGLRTTSFEPGRSVFIGCRFLDVRVKTILSSPHLIDCVVSGEWEGNFSAGHTLRRIRVQGNDFRQATGMAFRDGVDPYANRFDLGGRHLILRRDRECWQAACRLAEQGHPWIGMVLSSLRGEGPIGYGQDWTLLQRDRFTDAEWELLRGDQHDPGRPPIGRRVRQRLYGKSPARRRALAANLAEDFADDHAAALDGDVAAADVEVSDQGLHRFEACVVFIAAASPGRAIELHRSEQSIAAVVPTSLDFSQLYELAARVSGPSVSAVAAQIEESISEDGRVLLFALPAALVAAWAAASDAQIDAWSLAFSSDDSSMPSTSVPWEEDAVRHALHELRRVSQHAQEVGQTLFAAVTTRRAR